MHTELLACSIVAHPMHLQRFWWQQCFFRTPKDVSQRYIYLMHNSELSITTRLDNWNGLLEWATAWNDSSAPRNTPMAHNKISCWYVHCFLTWLLAIISSFFDYVSYNCDKLWKNWACAISVKSVRYTNLHETCQLQPCSYWSTSVLTNWHQ